ncbi:MAG: hypothetical protein H0W13_09370 [Nitrospirales bacterium]|nr:hypothetical protein [Nitrospirales bacterium]
MDKAPKSLVASSTEERLLDALRTSGTFTLDALSTLFDMSWGQAFLVVDRLSRSGHVALHRTDSREYLVSINAAMRTVKPASGAGA